jgi:hypothetical protein
MKRVIERTTVQPKPVVVFSLLLTVLGRYSIDPTTAGPQNCERQGLNTVRLGRQSAVWCRDVGAGLFVLHVPVLLHTVIIHQSNSLAPLQPR